MSADSAKKRIRKNNQLIATYFLMILGVNLAVFLLHLVCRWRICSFVNVSTLLVEFGIFLALRKISTPEIIKTQKKLEIKYEGADLSSRGLISILVDVMCISLFTKISGIFFKRAWIIFMLVPITGYYEIFLRKETRRKK